MDEKIWYKVSWGFFDSYCEVANHSLAGYASDETIAENIDEINSMKQQENQTQPGFQSIYGIKYLAMDKYMKDIDWMDSSSKGCTNDFTSVCEYNGE